MKNGKVSIRNILMVLIFFIVPILGTTPAAAKKAPDETKAMNPDMTLASEEQKKDGSEEKWGGRKLDHEKQGFVSIMPGTGYFLVAPWDKDASEKRCADSEDDPLDGEPVCSGRSGWHLDFQAGYGLKPGFELLLIFRLGLERPDNDGLLNQPKTRQLGAGVKFYNPSDGLFKIGFGVAALVDFSDRGPAAGVRNDLVIHVPIQAQFDVLPWVGPYAQVSPNISFISEFRLEFTGGIGVQGRFP